MSRLDGLRHRIYVLLRGESYADEVRRELRFHRELDALAAEGNSLGNETYYREEVRAMTWQLWIDRVMQDARYALRSLRRTPGFTIAVITTLGLGVGVNASAFSLLERVFLKPPSGVVAPVELRRLYVDVADSRRGRLVWPYLQFPQFTAIETALGSRVALAGYSPPESTDVRTDHLRAPARRSHVTATYFELLGVKPARGRFFLGEEREIPVPTRVAVISDAFWHRAFGGSESVLGRNVKMGPDTYTIIGVAPPNFSGTDLDAVDVWLPANTHGEGGGIPGLPWYQSLTSWSVLGRVASGSLDTDIATVGTQTLRPIHIPGLYYDSTTRVLVGPIVQARGPAETPGEMAVATRVAGVAALVLLIAFANILNLTLLRSAERGREIAVRRALGVSTTRLIAQFVVETLILAAGGALGALAFAVWGSATLQRLVLPNVHWSGSSLDAPTLAFIIAACAIIGAASGIVPAIRSMRGPMSDSLKAGMRQGAYRSSRLRGALLATQVALSVVLLVGAGLFIRSLRTVEAIGVGYDMADQVFIRPSFDDPAAHVRELVTAIPEAATRLRRSPNVEAIGFSTIPPMQGASYRTIYVPGRDSLPRFHGDVGPSMNSVSPDFFRAVGLRIVAGRDFNASDGRGTPYVAVVSKAMAETYWPGESALGKCFMVLKRDGPCYTIVGVVADAHRHNIIEPPVLQYYIAIAQSGETPRDLIVRTRPSKVPAVIRDAEAILRPLVSNMTGLRARRLQDIIEPQLRPWRLGARLIGALGMLALVVAALGVYAVVAYGVSQRAHEMGVRVALGASRRNVLELVLGDGLRTIVLGLMAGVAVALALGRLVASLLFGVTPTDPTVMIASLVLLTVVGSIACLLPAWRASAIDPVATLRSE